MLNLVHLKVLAAVAPASPPLPGLALAGHRRPDVHTTELTNVPASSTPPPTANHQTHPGDKQAQPRQEHSRTDHGSSQGESSNGPPRCHERRFGCEHGDTAGRPTAGDVAPVYLHVSQPSSPPPVFTWGDRSVRNRRPSSGRWRRTLPASRCMSSWPLCRRGWAARTGWPRRGRGRRRRGSSTGRRVPSWRRIWRG